MIAPLTAREHLSWNVCRGKRGRDPLEGYIKAPSTRHVLAIFHCVTFVLQENLAIPDDIY